MRFKRVIKTLPTRPTSPKRLSYFELHYESLGYSQQSEVFPSVNRRWSIWLDAHMLMWSGMYGTSQNSSNSSWSWSRDIAAYACHALWKWNWLVPVEQCVCKLMLSANRHVSFFSITVVSGYKPWARSAWQRDNTGSGTQNGAFAS